MSKQRILAEYPLARFVIEPERVNPAFDLFISKIDSKDGKSMGLKYTLKQKAQLSLSFLPIGDTPVQRFYFICVDHSIHTNSFVDF